jgi:YVTN family beta-propeller protein
MSRFLLFLTLCLGGVVGMAQSPKPAAKQANPIAALEANRVMLPNGWSLTPVGRSLNLDDLPLNMAVSPDQKRIAITNNGQSTQSIQLVDVQNEKILSTITIAKAWVGIKFSPDGKKVYASGSNNNNILVYSTEGDKLTAIDTLSLGKPLPNRMWVAGLELDKTGQTLFAVTKDDSTLHVVNVASGEVQKRIKLPADPYTLLRSPADNNIYISIWGGEQIAIYDPAQGQLIGSIPTGSHPNDLLFSKDGHYLFSANANDNTVTVIDATQRRVLETLNTALYPDAPAGSTPNGLALSPDQKMLYIANADNNALAVFDVSKPGKSRSLGFVPTGWYPTMVKVVGKKIFVTNGKGMASRANPGGPNPLKGRGSPDQYIGGMFKGTLSIIDAPTPAQLTAYTPVVYRNTPYTKERETISLGEVNNPVPRKVGDKSPIKYVFYIIRENRTYDQVFGDIKGGNGDTTLCLFPEKVTPNAHALARDYVLLDNFYVDAEVSADGHNWSTAAYATDYVEKIWPMSYGGRGGTYDFEGSRPAAYPKKGFIWDNCKRAGVSYRSYGEFEAYSLKKNSALDGHFSKNYPDYDLRVRDTLRVEIWKKELDSLVAINAVPRFNTVRLGNNHTSGARLGAPTPFAHVADNDLAIGKFVDYLSHSPIWAESAVFILEDDAQNGPDHVDAHRSPALVISPYTKRKHVEHSMYSTSGMLRTMELILGLPPMSQYDAAALPMFACFTSTPDNTPYVHKRVTVDMEAKNTAWNGPAKKSAEFDLRYADTINDDEFSEVIWMAVKGENSRMPAPKRGAWLRTVEKDDDGDGK